MPSATPDADVPELVNVGQRTVPDMRIPAAARANAAAALSTTRTGPATAPGRDELDRFLAGPGPS